MNRVRSPRQLAALALAALALAALGLRLWGIDYGLPNDLARPDEEKIVGAAAAFVREGRWRPATLIYPSLLIYLQAAAMAAAIGFAVLTGRFADIEHSFSEWPSFHYLVGRGTSAVLGAATTLVAYRLCRELGLPRASAVLAALLVAVAPLHVRDSHFATADAALAFFVGLALLLALRARRLSTDAALGAAAFAAGLAASTKYQGVLVLAAPLFVVGLRLRAGLSPARAAGRALLVPAVAALAFALTSPALIPRLPAVLAEIESSRRTVVAGDGELAALVHARVTLPAGFGVPCLIAAAVGLPALLRSNPAGAALLLSFALPWVASIAGARWVFPRYVTPLVPLIATLAAAGAGAIAGAAVRQAPRASRLALPLLAVLLAAPAVRLSVDFDRLAARPDTRLAVADWVWGWLPRGSRVVVCHGYTRPEIPRWRTRTIDCRRDLVPWEWADAIVLPAPHPQLGHFTLTSRQLRAEVEKRGRHLTSFDPFAPGRAGDAWFYEGDAFFIPMRGLGAMLRGGPGFDIYALPRPGGAFPISP